MVHWALKEMNLNYEFELIENKSILKKLGITKTPAMMINGKIVIEGRIPPLKEVKEILKREILEKKS